MRRRLLQVCCAVALVVAAFPVLSRLLAQPITPGTFRLLPSPPSAFQGTVRVQTGVTPNQTQLGCESFYLGGTTVNCLQIQGGPTTTGPAVQAIPAQGGDANIFLNLGGYPYATGAGGVNLDAGKLNYVYVTGGSGTGNTPTIGVQGQDPNISLILLPKGTGSVQLGGKATLGLGGTAFSSANFGTCSVSAPASVTPYATAQGQTPCLTTGNVTGNSVVFVMPNATGLEKGLAFTGELAVTGVANQVTLFFACVSSTTCPAAISSHTYQWWAINP